MPTIVGSKLREVEEVEQQRRLDENYFMRIRVALPISKPLGRGAYLTDFEGGHTWVTFKYERLPMLSHYCGFLGHDLRHYAGFFAVKKQNDKVQGQ